MQKEKRQDLWSCRLVLVARAVVCATARAKNKVRFERFVSPDAFNISRCCVLVERYGPRAISAEGSVWFRAMGALLVKADTLIFRWVKVCEETFPVRVDD